MVNFQSDDEATFIARTAEAWELIRLALPAVADQIVDHPDRRSQPPYTTIWRLYMRLGARCLAAIQALQLRETSEAALVLLRNSLEAYAHIEFIKGLPGASGNAACRSLRYEVGALKETRDVVQKVSPGDMEDEYRERHAEILSANCDCSCEKHPALTRVHVSSTLKVLAKREGMWVLPGLYSEASRATHMFAGADNLLSVSDAGGLDLTWVPLWRRAAWLIWMMVVFGHASWAAELIVVGDNGTSMLEESGFAARSRALINDPFLERIGHVNG